MVELTLLADAGSAEAVSDLLMEEHAALSVSVEDAEAGTAAERGLFGEPGMPPPGTWNRSIVKALFADVAQATEAATRLLAAFGADQAHGDNNHDDANIAECVRLVSIEPVVDQDWVRLTQAQFGPTEIAPGFWVVPSWHAPPAAAARVLRLDPGMAFGTGTHPTTRMCLRWIARAAVGAHWNRVLDYGCGSGILAIAAAMHGATAVDAVDIDPDAISAAAANAAANGMAIHTGLPDTAQGRYSLVLANILATPLKLLAPLLCRHLASGADLVLAGILERQATDMAAAYRPWLALEVSDQEDGWVLMHGRSARTPTA